MNVKEWQLRLEQTFEISQGSNPLLDRLAAAEAGYGAHVQSRYHGHRALRAAFMALFHDSLVRSARAYSNADIVHASPYQPALFLDFLTNFRSFCAAESLLYSGYPLDGYGLLRDLKDEAGYLAALARGDTDYRRLRGYAGKEPTDLEEVRKSREAEERRLSRLTFGDELSLTDASRHAIKRWSAMFHLEVHGSRLTTTEFLGWIRSEEPLSLLPVPKERSMGVYVTTAPIIFWMHLRCLPFLQLQPSAFGVEWARKWHVLDDSFRWLLGTWESADKTLPGALISLIDGLFAFDTETCYVERAGPDADV